MRYLEFPVLVPHRPGRHAIESKERTIRRIHRLADSMPVVFLEVSLGDPSEFLHQPVIDVVQENGRFVDCLANCVSVAHAIAGVALDLSQGRRPPEVHFGWSDRHPFWTNLSFLLFGEGNDPWLVRELVRRAEPNRRRRPRIIVG